MCPFKSNRQRKYYFAKIKTNKSNLTNIEKKNINKSIKEELKAEKDYKSRAKQSKNKKVKSTFKHIAKEEKTHSKEFKELI